MVEAMMGAIFVLIALAAGILKCVRLLGKAAASKVCISSLLLALVAWSISVLVGLTFGPGPASGVCIGGAVMSFLLSIAALTTGIVGLATFDRQRFNQGRGQAIAALVIGGLICGGFVVGVLIGVMKVSRPARLEAGAPTGGRSIECPDFNFSLTPPAGWATIKPQALNKLACLALRSVRPDIFCLVIGERTAGAIEMDSFTEVVKGNLSSAAEVLRQSQAEEVIDGLTFVHLRSLVRAHAANLDLAYEHWLATHRGFAWQVILWTPAAEEASLAPASRRLAETFRVLDRAKDAAGPGSLADVERPEWGYSTHLAGLGWGAWKSKEKGNAQVDFRAERVNEALLVLPVRFESEVPDLEALARGLLRTLGFTYPSEADFKSEPWSPAHGGEGLAVATERESEGDRFRYLLRVARGKGSAHFLAGWASTKGGDLELVRKSLDAITISQPQGPAPPLDSAKRTARGLLLNEVGLSCFERKDHAAAARWFREAFEATRADLNILVNAGHALELAGRPEEGRDYLAPLVVKFPQAFEVGCRYARLQALAGDAEAGNRTFLDLIERGLKDEEELGPWLNLLVARKAAPLARRAADAWVARNPTAGARRLRAQTVFESGDSKAALEEFEKLAAEQPDDLNALYDLGEHANRAGDHVRGAEVAEKLVAGGKDPPRALAMLGWSQMGRGWYREAKATFERAARKAPADEDLQEGIRQASASLGEGDNSSIKEPIEAVAIPAEVREAIGDAPPAEFGQGHAAVWQLLATGYRFERDRPLRKTIHRQVKVLTTEGANDFSSLEIRFDPLAERIFMNRLEVKDGAGKTVDRGSVDDAYVRDLDDGTANHRKVLHLKAPGLKPGHFLEMEVTTEGRSPITTFPFQRYLMSNALPAAAEAVFIVGDAPAVKAEAAQGEGLKVLRSGKLAAWIGHRLPAAPSEPLSVWMESWSPMIWLAGDAGDWKKVGKTYLEEIADRLQPDPAAAELAATLTAGLKTDARKAAALIRETQKQIGYQAIEFGVRARQPSAPAETLRRRFGDCKDHALLLHQLLLAAGIRSHLALVNTDWRIRPGLPSMDQFNHMVVLVPALGSRWLVDATDKHLQLEAFPADRLWHSHALVLDPAGPRLLAPPPPPAPKSSSVESRRTVTPAGRHFQVRETFALNGYYAAWMRAAFSGRSAAEQSQKAQDILAEFGAVQVQDFHFAGLEDPAQPARLELSYLVHDALTTVNGKTSATLPALWERDYIALRFVKDRRTPFIWRYPFRFSSDVTVKLPAPATEASLAALAYWAKVAHVSWSLDVLPGEPGSPDLHLRFEFEARPCEEPAAAYAGYQEAWEAPRRAWDRAVEWPSG